MLLAGFSLMSRKGFRGEDSPVNSCMWDFAGYVSRVKPLLAIFESVQQAYTQGVGLMRSLRAKVEYDTGQRWDLYHVLHNNASLGGAAIRKRYFWVISRVPFGVERVPLTKMPTTLDVFGDLENLGITWEAQPYQAPPSYWAKPRRSDTGLVDGMMCHLNPASFRYRDLMKNVGWNPREIVSEVARRHYVEHGDLPESFLPRQREKLPKTDFRMGIHQPIRWSKEQACRVLTGAALETVVHPTQDRLLTHREVARVQGFPDDWLIRPLRGERGLRATWGKGIPVDCGEWVGTWIRNSIEGRPGSYTGEPGGQDREYIINVTHDFRAITDER